MGKDTKKEPKKETKKGRSFSKRTMKKRDEEFSKDAALGMSSMELASKFDISEKSTRM